MIETFLRFIRLCVPLGLLVSLQPGMSRADTCPEDCSEPTPPSVNIYSRTTAGHLSPALSPNGKVFTSPTW